MVSAWVCIIWLAYPKVNFVVRQEISKWVILAKLGYNTRKVQGKERDCLGFVQLVLLEEVLLISSGMIFLEGYGEQLRRLYNWLTDSVVVWTSLYTRLNSG